MLDGVERGRTTETGEFKGLVVEVKEAEKKKDGVLLEEVVERSWHRLERLETGDEG